LIGGPAGEGGEGRGEKSSAFSIGTQVKKSKRESKAWVKFPGKKKAKMTGKGEESPACRHTLSILPMGKSKGSYEERASPLGQALWSVLLQDREVKSEKEGCSGCLRPCEQDEEGRENATRASGLNRISVGETNVGRLAHWGRRQIFGRSEGSNPARQRGRAESREIHSSCGACQGVRWERKK